jgi:competence protein ComEC
MSTLHRIDRAMRRAVLWLGMATVALFAIALGTFLGRGHPAEIPPDQLAVTVVNVGHGEASWIKTPSGKFIVIGGGPATGGRQVADSLRAAGAEKIDLLILPYPYAEAIGGVPAILDVLPVVEAVEPGGPEVNQWQAQVRAYLDRKKARVRLGRAGENIYIDNAKIEILAPREPLLDVTPASANNSLVVRVRWGQTSFLWAGGIEKAGEEALIANTPDLHANWLRVARFGNRSASSPEFLRLVMPEYTVVSTGANRDNLPHRETMERLEATGANVYRTDTGPRTFTFYSDGAQVFGPP